MAKRVLLVVDIQNDDFPGGKRPLGGIEQAAEHARRIVDFARARGEEIMHIRHEFAAADAPFLVAGSMAALSPGCASLIATEDLLAA